MPLHWHMPFPCRQVPFLQWLESNMNTRNIKKSLVFLSSQCLKSTQQPSWVALFHCSIIFDFYIMGGLQPTQPSVLGETAQNRSCTCPGDRAWPCAVCGVDLLQPRGKAPLWPCSTSLCCPAHPHQLLLAAPEPGWEAELIPSDVPAGTRDHPLPNQGTHVTPTPKQTSLLLLFTSAHLQPFGFGLLRSRWQPGACQSFWSFQRHSYFLIKDWRSSKGARTTQSRFMSSQAGRESDSDTVCSSFSLVEPPGFPQLTHPAPGRWFQFPRWHLSCRTYSHLTPWGDRALPCTLGTSVGAGGGDRMVSTLLWGQFTARWMHSIGNWKN